MQFSLLSDALPSGIEAYRVDLDLDADLARVWPLLNEEERAAASRFRQRADQVRSAFTRATLRQLLAQRLDCNPLEVSLCAGTHGKPFAINTNGVTPPLFNVSHSGAHALIAIADAKQMSAVGIDIERCDVDAQMQTILDIAFTPRERQDITAAKDPQAALYAQWVSKEAALKALGVGIATDMQSIDIGRAPDGSLAVHGSVPGWQTLRVMALAAPAGYAAALAWQ